MYLISTVEHTTLHKWMEFKSCKELFFLQNSNTVHKVCYKLFLTSAFSPGNIHMHHSLNEGVFLNNMILKEQQINRLFSCSLKAIGTNCIAL